MTAVSPAQLLADVTATVSYLRVAARRDADASLDWLSCAELVSDPDRLLAVVRSTAAGRGTDRDDIAISLFVQAYAFRIASIAIGGWLLSESEHTFDVRPANSAIALGRHRPNAVALNHVKFHHGSIHDALFQQHLAPLVAAAHEATADSDGERVGEKMLWGNVGAGCAASFGAFHGNVADRDSVRAAVDRFWAEAPAEVAGTGRFVTFSGEQAEPGWFWERSSCCLWYQIPPADPAREPFKCEDCSLWTADERAARYRRATALEGAE